MTNSAESPSSELTSIPEDWCDGATDYWKTQSPTVRGMLGGFDNLADLDVKGSRKFLASFVIPKLPEAKLVLDVGAGIGRVSRDLLLGLFEKVSLLECTETFISQAKENLPVERIESIFPVTMQDFKADVMDHGKYDLVWIQWVIIYATDDGLVNFLKECNKLIKKGGRICIKDNVILPPLKFRDSQANEDYEDVLLDQEDCSITRSERYLLELARRAGLELDARDVQTKFPKKIFPVVMYSFAKTS